MSLKPALSLVSIADPAAQITVADSTGNYSTTNPGGFGSPNPLKTDVQIVILQLAYLADLTSYFPYEITDPTNIFAAGQALPSGLFSQGTVYSDGVFDVRYDLGFTGTAPVSYAANDLAFTMAGADTIFANADGFIIPSLNRKKLYYIDRTKALTNTGGYVTEELPSSIGTSLANYIFFEGDLKILVIKAGAKCLINDIGVWADEGCHDREFRDIWKRYKQQLAVTAKFTQGYVYDAHNLAVALNAYCSLYNNVCPC